MSLKIKKYTKKGDEREKAEQKIAFLRLRKPSAPKIRLNRIFNRRTLRIFWLILALILITAVVVFPLVMPFLYTPTATTVPVQ